MTEDTARSLVLKLSGGPEPDSFIIADAQSGVEYTNLEFVSLLVNQDGAELTVTLRNALVLDMVANPAYLLTPMVKDVEGTD